MRSAYLLAAAIGAASCSNIVTPTLDAYADAPTLLPGQQTQLHVTRHFPGGPVDDVTTQVVYAVVQSKPILTVSPAGVVAASTDGIATVTITDKDDQAFASVRITVTAQ